MTDAKRTLYQLDLLEKKRLEFLSGKRLADEDDKNRIVEAGPWMRTRKPGVDSLVDSISPACRIAMTLAGSLPPDPNDPRLWKESGEKDFWICALRAWATRS